MTPPSPSCNWRMCPNDPSRLTAAPVRLQACSRCKTVAYCGKGCQKKDWGHHKHKFQPADATRHEVEDFTVQSIQNAIDAAAPGDIVILREGTYGGSPELVVNKPLKLWGPSHGMEKTNLECNLIVRGSGLGNDSKGNIALVDFGVSGICNITENMYKTITLSCVKVQCPNESDSDALTITNCNGKFLLLDSEIFGGSDGVHIHSENVYLKLSDIRFCRNRGIFSRRWFTIEDCEVSNCGGYGIKGTAGWDQRGTMNEIQPGPWGAMGPGGMW